MGDLATYSLNDFVPFTPEVYFRLFTRLNEAVWPAHLAAVLVAGVIVWSAVRGRGRTVGILLAICWGWVGWIYHFELYASLNWAGTYSGWAFLVQSALLVAYGVAGRLDRHGDGPPDGPSRVALALATFGLVMVPLFGPLSGRGWGGLQIFGVAPDPTALATLGFVLTAERTRWLLVVIPVVWCLWSGATGWVVGDPSGLMAAGASVLALVVAAWKTIAAQ
jgi:hypothetical protein